MTLHFSHIGFTEARTFIAPVSSRIQDPRAPHESDGRVKHGPHGPTKKDSRRRILAATDPGVADLPVPRRPDQDTFDAVDALRRATLFALPDPALESRPGRRRRRRTPRDPGHPGRSRACWRSSAGRSAPADPRVRHARRLLTIAMARCLPPTALLTTLEFDPTTPRSPGQHRTGGRRRPRRPARRRRPRDPPPARLRRLPAPSTSSSSTPTRSTPPPTSPGRSIAPGPAA